MNTSSLLALVIIHLFVQNGSCAYFPPIDATWQKQAETVVGSDKIGSPQGIFIDRDNTLYIADVYNYRIVKLEYGSTNVSVVLDGLDYPTDLVIDKKGTMFVAEKESLTRWPKGFHNRTILARAEWLLSVAIDPRQEHLYITDYFSNYVKKYIANGEAEQNGTVVVPNAISPWSVAINGIDTVFAASYYGSVREWKRNESGEGKVVIDQLGEPRGISLDCFGTLYIANCGGNSVVRVLAGSKTATVIAAGNGIGDAPDQLYNPADAAFDSYGNLYVSDYGNGRVQRFRINQKTLSQ
ncbi:unnamed protein product [Adineta ricciae]|uniref:SMP-30/Gluconolactonase/LRE-like region domain-containing protein n=1 Tax=Adineta ricciae TaxID=249248 RepID=A0A813RVA9_ADIRI|nr:unnamed protein product [Adineta ricciae]CAF1473519.1 unnamed protein product [Adineta ricciae]